MARCPLCDFTGPSGSVEAHISGCTDDDHRGEVGWNYRERINATVGEDDGRAERPALEGDEVAEPPTSDRPPATETEGEVSATWAVLGATIVLALLVIATASTSTGGGGSISDGSDSSDGSASSSTADDREGELAARFQ